MLILSEQVNIVWTQEFVKLIETQYKASLTVRVEQGWAKLCLFANTHCILFSHITYNWYKLLKQSLSHKNWSTQIW